MIPCTKKKVYSRFHHNVARVSCHPVRCARSSSPWENRSDFYVWAPSNDLRAHTGTALSYTVLQCYNGWYDLSISCLVQDGTEMRMHANLVIYFGAECRGIVLVSFRHLPRLQPLLLDPSQESIHLRTTKL